MLNFINQLFGDKNQREITRNYEPVVAQIHEATLTVKALSDDELRGSTQKYRNQIQAAVAEIEDRRKEIHDTLRTGSLDGVSLTLEDRQDFFDELDELEDEWHEVAEETLDEILPEGFCTGKRSMSTLVGRWIPKRFVQPTMII